MNSRPIFGIGEAVSPRAEARDKIQDAGSQHELYGHMHTRCEKGEVEIKCFLAEHPSVILCHGSAPSAPWP